jgi:hypothetical protein
MTEQTDAAEVAVTRNRLEVLRRAADELWSWGWYDLADQCRAALAAQVDPSRVPGEES